MADAFKISPEQIEKELQRRSGESFRLFTRLANPRFTFFRHCELLADVLEKVASGEIKRLLISLPPRHSKSEMISRLFTAYYLKKNPHHFVGVNSYSAELAYTLSRASRENFQRCGGIVKDDVSAVKHWETTTGGGMWAAGVGGSITGKGFHLGLIDDPLKNSEEAASDTIRDKQKEWYSSTFYTRGEPDSAIIVIQTRWHEDDLTGWLLSEEKGEEPEKWHVVNLPAIYDEDSYENLPASCTSEPDFRQEIGAALCPERYDAPKLKKMRARIGEYHFDALFQQRPTSKKGLFFDVSKLEIVDVAPAVVVSRVRGWDKAATSGDGDFTVGARVSKDKEDIYYVEDIVRGQWDTATRDRNIKQTAETDGKKVKIRGEQEPGSGGVFQAQTFIRMLGGFSVKCEKATTNKEVRADAFSSQINAGNVRLVRGDWNKAFIEELRKFPRGKHDDQVDSASLAFNAIAKSSGAVGGF
jgi:predicted phage terminase large subunit-like protein